MMITRNSLHSAVLYAFALAMLLFSSGCGAMAAATNPKVAWALGDPATMTVVMRRAEVAEQTGKHVDRLMTATPADDDSPWLKKSAPAPDEAKKRAEETAKRDLYATTGARVVPAEVWSQTLAEVAARPDTPTLTAADVPAAPAATAAAKPEGKGKGNGKGKKDKPAPVVVTTPPVPAAPPKYASLLAVVDAALVDRYAAVMAKKRALGEAKAQIAREEAAADEKGVSDADKAAHKAKADELEKKADQLEAEAKAMEKDFIAAASASAAKVAPDVRDRFGAVFVNLRQAVDDAEIANGAAALRYPLAVPTLPTGAQEMVHVYVADVIEERTGKRPETRGLQPGVTLERGKVQITLNGLSAADAGKLSIDEVVAETAKRTQAWVTRALGLLGTIAGTKEVLGFERDVLDAVLSGWKGAGWTPPPSPVIPTITPPPPPGAKPRKA